MTKSQFNSISFQNIRKKFLTNIRKLLYFLSLSQFQLFYNTISLIYSLIHFPVCILSLTHLSEPHALPVLHSLILQIGPLFRSLSSSNAFAIAIPSAARLPRFHSLPEGLLFMCQSSFNLENVMTQIKVPIKAPAFSIILYLGTCWYRSQHVVKPRFHFVKFIFKKKHLQNSLTASLASVPMRYIVL